MQLMDIIKYIDSQFVKKDLKEYKTETGVIFDARKDIKKIGYCTNITPKTIELASESSVDLMITHHDAWDSVPGLREACTTKLNHYNMSAYFNHTPLDDCNFGTNDTFIKKTGP